jgi:hypothetical protein
MRWLEEVEKSVVNRFWDKVLIPVLIPSAPFNRENTCWIWQGAKGSGAGSLHKAVYGNFKLYGRRVVKAHRFAWELFHGPIPEGMSVDHKCGNTLCCNPSHLELVTIPENTRRQNARKALKQGQLKSGVCQ